MSKFIILIFSSQIQKKYEELRDKYNKTEKEKNILQNEYSLLLIKIKKLEENINSKTEENEKLKIKINDFTKKSIV